MKHWFDERLAEISQERGGESHGKVALQSKLGSRLKGKLLLLLLPSPINPPFPRPAAFFMPKSTEISLHCCCCWPKSMAFMPHFDADWVASGEKTKLGDEVGSRGGVQSIVPLLPYL